MTTWLTPARVSSGFQLDVFPGIRIARADRAREHVLPFRCLDPRPDRVHESVAEHRHEIVVLEDRALDLLRQSLALLGLLRCQVLVVLGIEFFDAELVGGEHAAAFEVRLVPIGPAGADSCAGEDDVDAGPLLYPTLLPLLINRSLQSLQPGANADRLQL